MGRITTTVDSRVLLASLFSLLSGKALAIVFAPLLLAGEAIIMGVIYLVLVVIIRHPIAAELLTTAKSLLHKSWNPR